MKDVIFCTRMYDPVAQKLWWEPHRIQYNSAAELQAKIAKIQARHELWTGEKSHD